MKRFLPLVLICVLPVALSAQTKARDQGTIVRMRMADCIGSAHPWMDALSGTNRAPSGELCPEYVLVTDTVVYVIIGRNADQLVPLAETTRFHLRNNELLIRVDDARRESRFRVKAMVLRSEWDRNQQIEEAAAIAAAHHVDEASVVQARQ